MGWGLVCLFVVKTLKQMSCAWLVASAESSLLASGRVLASTLGLGPERPLVIERKQKNASWSWKLRSFFSNSKDKFCAQSRMGGQFCITSALPTTMGSKQKQRCIRVTYEPVANACINANDDTSPQCCSTERLSRLHGLLR